MLYDKSLSANTKYSYKVRAYKTYSVKKYYNSKSKKWQTKKPNKKYWKACPSGKYKGKKTIYVTYYKYGKYSSLKTIKTKGHALKAFSQIDASCTKDGQKAYWKCSYCGMLFEDSNGTKPVSMESIIIKAGGHNLQKHDSVEPTCETDGKKEYYSCKVCGKYFSDSKGENEVENGSWEIDAKGHTVVIDPEVPAKDEETGLTEGSHCSVCQKVLVKQEVIPALGEGKTKHLITYDIYGGDLYLEAVGVDNSNPEYYYSEDGLTLKNLKSPGYIFEGWYDGEGSNAEQIKRIEVGETSDFELFAHWKPREYTITFDSNLVPVNSINYTVDKGATLTSPSLFGYNFMGWSDDNGNIVKKIDKGTIGNITLTANWSSKRNQTRVVNELGNPIIYEDEDNGQILFAYELGQIENVPLYEIKNLGNSCGITVEEEYAKSNSISESRADSIVDTIEQTTTKTTTWSLSKDWNKSLTKLETKTNEQGKEVVSSSGSVSNDSTVCVTGDSNGGTFTITTENSANLSAKVSVDAEAGVNAGYVSGKVAVGAETGVGSSWSAGASDVTTWGTSNGLTKSSGTSSSSSVSSALSNKISSTYGYNKTYSEGGSMVTANSSSSSQTEAKEYSTSFSYTNGTIETITKKYSNANAPEGYYRIVCAGTVHVFGVVGYDIANKDYYAFTYAVQDDNTYDFIDYSRTTPNFNDNENGVIPFEIPYSVNTYITELVGDESEFEVYYNADRLVSYKGDDVDVVIPKYVVTTNANGDKKAVIIKEVGSEAFKDNTKIKTVELGGHVSTISSSAFEGCTSLERVKGSGLVEIGNSAFAGCTSLESVEGSKVVEIGNSAFAECTSLKYSAPDTLSSYSWTAFSGIKRLEIKPVENNGQVFIASASAEELVLDLSEISSDCVLTIDLPASTKYFELKNYRNSSNSSIWIRAEQTVFNNCHFYLSGDSNPIVLWSNTVKLLSSSINNDTCDSTTMILQNDNVEMIVEGSALIGSNGSDRTALLCKNLNIAKGTQNSDVKLSVMGNIETCGTVTDNSGILDLSIGEIVEITLDEFISNAPMSE